MIRLLISTIIIGGLISAFVEKIYYTRLIKLLVKEIAELEKQSARHEDQIREIAKILAEEEYES